MRDLSEHELGSQHVYQGRLLDVRKDEVRLPDGGVAFREYIVHPGAVAILPLLDDKTILLERQYRYALRRHFYELPAGKIEDGEDELQTAQRELLEETGYVAETWKYLLTLHPCVAYSSEHIAVYLARELRFQGHPGEDGEFVETLLMPITQAQELLARGEITDAKTIIGVLWAQRIGRELVAAASRS